MPTYVYRCSYCKYQFEKAQKFSDAPIKRCPNCRRKGVHKVLHPAPIQFKGSGWYSTDSKKSSVSASSGRTKKKESSTEPASADATSSTTTGSSDAS